MFDMPWIELCWPNASIETGANGCRSHFSSRILVFECLPDCLCDSGRCGPAKVRLRLRHATRARRSWRGTFRGWILSQTS